ncbi:MAG: hypothetical protein LBQ98_06540 [Nitrososphaerota archaeon]|nr:hypothetical protein [Nitrososphaerota archaeon]
MSITKKSLRTPKTARRLRCKPSNNRPFINKAQFIKKDKDYLPPHQLTLGNTLDQQNNNPKNYVSAMLLYTK